MTNIYEALSQVQQELKVPKNQKNSFGGYSYRSAEDILEALKPVLAKHGLTLVVSDQIEQHGDRYYIRATARLLSIEPDPKAGTTSILGNSLDSVEAYGYAREEETKKGMDGSQITGAASSYARKYALNGLFNIDDTKDADTDEHRKQNSAPAPATQQPPAESAEDVLKRAKLVINKELESQDIVAVAAKKAFITSVIGKSTIENLDQADEVMEALEMNKEAS